AVVAAEAEDPRAGGRRAGLYAAPVDGAAAGHEGAEAEAVQAGGGVEVVAVEGLGSAGRAGGGGGRGLGREGRLAPEEGGDDVEVGGVAGEAGVRERGRRRRAD